MSKQYEDWADWAGDHTQEAERKAREHNISVGEAERVIAAVERVQAAKENKQCGHTEVYATGHCADCGAEVDGFEPDDIQIFNRFGTKEIAA